MSGFDPVFFPPFSGVQSDGGSGGMKTSPGERSAGEGGGSSRQQNTGLNISDCFFNLVDSESSIVEDSGVSGDEL